MKSSKRKTAKSGEISGKKKEYSVEKLRKIIPCVSNSSRRRYLAGKLRRCVKKEQSRCRRARKAAKERGDHVETQTPKTIESLRLPDETIVEEDPEIQEADVVDEFASYIKGETQPKILISTSKNPSTTLKRFIQELLLIIPSSFYYKRGSYRLKSIMKYAKNKSFTDVIILSDHFKEPSAMLICHLPNGPTSFFRLTNVKLAQDMRGSGALTTHLPEILLNNFVTRIGRRVAKQLMALFPQKPEFTGRRAICFHNQRDFIFFRHHRYIFCNGGSKCKLQEIGPRFTMKLRYIQSGVYDGRKGLLEYQWRPDSQVNRKVMFL